MSVQCESAARRSAAAQMPFFEHYLSVWVVLCILTGIGLGHVLPGLFRLLLLLQIL